MLHIFMLQEFDTADIITKTEHLSHIRTFEPPVDETKLKLKRVRLKLKEKEN